MTFRRTKSFLSLPLSLGGPPLVLIRQRSTIHNDIHLVVCVAVTHLSSVSITACIAVRYKDTWLNKEFQNSYFKNKLEE